MELLQAIMLQGTFWTSGVAFASPMEKRESFVKRFAMASLVLCSTFFGAYLLSQQGWNFTLLILKTGTSFLMMWFLHFCWDITWSVALYDAIWAVSLWLLLFEVWKVIRVIAYNNMGENQCRMLLYFLLLYIFAYTISAHTIAKWMPTDRKNKLGPRQMLSAILIYSLIQMLSLAPALQTIQVGDDNWKVLLLSQIVCVIILYLQNELFKKSDMKQELELMNLLWKKEKEQYELARENIALLNQKSHDLKHQIRALRKVSKEEFEQYLAEMEDNVRIYEAIVKTGNDVFDTILTEKSLYCKDQEIQVTCVADGSQMDFIHTVDLYAILGNAMDNAIEAVQKFDEKEKRQIDVMIYRQQNFLVMNIINPMPEKLVYEEELPVSTKGDKLHHGFGLRSMKYIVKKYDGFVNISEEDGCFSLKILIPIPNIIKN